MPLISVIIPVFNGESYLRSCLESVLSQTLADFEAIVVDDGSTDGSSRICDEFSARDDRIRVIHQFNQGVSAARNAGLELATGQYIFFIDGDDTIVPETLESLYDAASDGDYDIAASGYSLVKETGEAENHVVVSGSSSVFSGDSIIEWMLSDADTVWFVCWGKLIHRRLLFPSGELSIRFEKIMQEDMLFCMTLYLRAAAIVYLDKVLYRYIDRADSLSKRKSYIGVHRTVPVFWRLLGSIPDGKPVLRSKVLLKLYRRIIGGKYYLYKTPDLPSSDVEEFHRTKSVILKQTRKEFLLSPMISLRDKVGFVFGNWFPGLLHFYLDRASLREP